MYDTNPLPNGQIVHGYPNLKTIKKSITALYQHLSSQDIKKFSHGLAPDVVSIIHNTDLIMAIQRLASAIAQHLKLPGGSILVTFKSNLQSSGRVELSGRDGYFVELHSRYQHDCRDIPAILAHEITHVFLHRAGLGFPDTHDNEILTDTAAVYLGVGWLCLNAYRRNEWYSESTGGRVNVTTQEEQLGYLTPEEFGYVLGKRVLVFNETPDKLLTSVAAHLAYKEGYRKAVLDSHQPPLRDCGLGRRSLYTWRRRYLQSAASNGDLNGQPSQFEHYRFEVTDTMKVIFECPVCCQQLRLPTYRRALRARCSVCTSELSCRT